MTGRHLLVVSGCAVAAAAFGAGATRAAENGFFAYVDVGRAEVERVIGDFDRVDGNDFSWNAGFGYAFGRYASVRLGYQDFGDLDATLGCPPDVLCIAEPGGGLVASSPTSVHIDAVSLQLIGHYPLQSIPVGLFAKIGASAWNSDWRGDSRLNESETDLLFGAGVDWRTGDRLRLQLAYEETARDIRAITLGTSFAF